MTALLSEIEKTAFKKRLRTKCIELIEQRINATIDAISNAQAAANAEEKSSAGDKYETSRAMNHLEKDMHSRQLTANRQELEALFGIDCSRLYDSVSTGSFILCSDHSFFIAAGLGKIKFEGNDIYLLSPVAPMSKILFKKKQGDDFTFNKTGMVIIEVF